MIYTNNNKPEGVSRSLFLSEEEKKEMPLTKNSSVHALLCACALPLQVKTFTFWRGARLSQRVAMDDLASHFVEERSKVR